jgi:hypothetical protein
MVAVRRPRPSHVAWVAFLASMLGCGSSASIDPGQNYVLSQTVFDQDYFYCHVEPEFLFGASYTCGGSSANGDPGGGCHFNASAVTGMVLIDHPLIDCGGGDTPLDPTQVATGSPANDNSQSASFEMSTDWESAPIYVRPSGYMGQAPPAHPKAIFQQGDTTVVALLSTWATQ